MHVAQPIQTIDARSLTTDPKIDLTDYAEAINQALRLVDALAKSGLLSFVEGLAEQKDGILAILIQQLNQDGPKNVINNLEGLLAILANLPPDFMDRTAEAIDQGMAAVKKNTPSDEPYGPLKIIRSLKNPDVSRAMHVLFTLLEFFGRSLKVE